MRIDSDAVVITAIAQIVRYDGEVVATVEASLRRGFDARHYWDTRHVPALGPDETIRIVATDPPLRGA